MCLQVFIILYRFYMCWNAFISFIHSFLYASTAVPFYHIVWTIFGTCVEVFYMFSYLFITFHSCLYVLSTCYTCFYRFSTEELLGTAWDLFGMPHEDIIATAVYCGAQTPGLQSELCLRPYSPKITRGFLTIHTRATVMMMTSHTLSSPTLTLTTAITRMTLATASRPRLPCRTS